MLQILFEPFCNFCTNSWQTKNLPLSVFIQVAAQLKIIPHVKQQITIQEVFSNGLLVATLYTSIAVFGLFIGILQIFVVSEPVIWIIVGPFLLISFLLQISFINNVIKPKIQLIQEQELYS